MRAVIRRPKENRTHANIILPARHFLLLLVLRNFLLQRIRIRSHQFIDFLSIAVQLKGRHGTDAAHRGNIFDFVDIDLGEFDRIDFVREFFKNRANEFTRAAPVNL